MFVVLPLACGGRVIELPKDTAAGGGAGTAGSGSSGLHSIDEHIAGAGGATTNGGATSSHGARSSGGAAASSAGGHAPGGATGTGGSVCLCLDIGCAPGYAPVPPAPGECCSTECKLDCSGVGCSAIDLDCKPGWHVGNLPDECCPLCVPNVPIPCDEAIKRYDAFREERIAQYQALGCEPAGACAIFGESNRCRQTCGTPIPLKGRDFIEEDLGNFAADYCTACPKPLPVPCPAPPLSRCLDNVCSSASGVQ